MEPNLPPPPPAHTQSVAKSAAKKFRYTPGFYKALLVHDARDYGVAEFDPESLREVNRFVPEYRGKFLIKPGDRGLETQHLRITATIDKKWVVKQDARFRTDHLNLRIENKSDKNLAYIVETSLFDEKFCTSRGLRLHNALSIHPREVIERSECIYHGTNDLWVERVDVLEMTELGYYYIGRLTPLTVGIEPRIAEQHRPPTGAQYCRHIPQEELAAAGNSGDRWPHVMDFYARHNCDEYWFFSAYRRKEQPLSSLEPARPPSGE